MNTDYNLDWVLYAIAIALGCFLLLVTARYIAIRAMNRISDRIEHMLATAIEKPNRKRDWDAEMRQLVLDEHND